MRTLISSVLIAACVAGLTWAPVHAAMTPPPKPKASPAPTAAPAASASEKQFVAMVTKDLQSRFGTTAQAAAAGYFRYTGEDQTGAISWVNTKNWQSDPKHPSQLWYDAGGRLIGVDFSVLQSGTKKVRPTLWGVSASRWLDFSPAHVHFGIKTKSGIQYSGFGSKTMKLVGGSIAHPTAEDVVKLGKTTRWKVFEMPAARTSADVDFVFAFPSVWDLDFWLVPNPLGSFAEYNPSVKPTKNATYQD